MEVDKLKHLCPFLLVALLSVSCHTQIPLFITHLLLETGFTCWTLFYQTENSSFLMRQCVFSTYQFVFLKEILKICLDWQKRCVAQKWNLCFLVHMHNCAPMQPFPPSFPPLSPCSSLPPPPPLLSLSSPCLSFVLQPRLTSVW